jgi:hypothetical protein
VPDIKKINEHDKLLDCYSVLADVNCRTNNTNNENDQIFFKRQCRTVADVCAGFQLTGFNVTNCFNSTANEIVPINSIIRRTLSSEEFY